MCSGTNSHNVKGRLQAVACIHTTPSKSSNPIKKGRSLVTGIKCLQTAGFLAEVICDVAKLGVLFTLLEKMGNCKHSACLYLKTVVGITLG